MDKYFGGPRRGGVHIYRTSLLEKAKDFIPDEGTTIRPERYILEKMNKHGYRWKQVPYIVGIHDDEQYNIDIYRKALVQSVKHLNRAELFISLWKEKMNFDHDFKVALRGFIDGIQNFDKLYINSSQQLYQDLFKQTGFIEKESISLKDFSLEDIEKSILSWKYHDIYFKYFPDRDGLDNSLKLINNKVKQSVLRNGLRKTINLGIANLLIFIGKRIIR